MGNKTASKRPDMKERTPLSAYMHTYIKYISDPDKILKTKSGGKGRQIYDKMLDDDGHLKACVNTRKLAVINLGHEILPHIEKGASEATERDMQIASEIEYILTQAENFENDMREMLNAYQYGFSVGEILWKIQEGLVMIEDIKSRKPDYFAFDKDYNLVYTERIGKEEVILDKEKFVIYTLDPRCENPYGTSLLRTCYWAVWFKANMIRFLMLFAERFGNPTIYGKYPTGWSPGEIEELVEQLGTIHANAVGAISKDAEIALIESMRKESEFIAAFNFFNSEMSKAVLGQTLTTDEGARSGSFALGKVHASVRDDYVAADARDIQAVCQKQVVDRLVEFNYGPDAYSPRFVIPYKAEENMLEKAKTYGTLAKEVGVEFTKQHIHDKFDIPIPQEGEEVYGGKKPAPETPPFGGGGFQFSSKQFQRVGKRPLGGTKIYDIATSLTYYDDMAAVMRRAFADVQRQLMAGLSPDTPMHGLIDQAVRMALDESFEYQIAKMKGDTVMDTANLFSGMFGLGKIEQALQRSVFEQIKNEYLTKEFYAKGRIRGIGNTMRSILQNKVPDWREVGFDVGQMKQLLKTEFTKLADWKVHQIAQEELMQAAEHSAFEMIERTGLEYEAWFLVDPASCDICQGIAANNPYTVAEGRSMGRPHIGCNDQWSFTLKARK